MSDNVVRIGADIVLPDEPDPHVIETLEGLLERAKAGTLRGIAFATVSGKTGDELGTAWSATGVAYHALSSAVILLHRDYATGLMKDCG